MMPFDPLLRVAALFAAATLCTGAAIAAPGDVFVPAHRTHDGTLVPPNVAPLSGGNRPVRRALRGRARAPQAPTRHTVEVERPSGITSPLFVAAPALRR